MQYKNRSLMRNRYLQKLDWLPTWSDVQDKVGCGGKRGWAGRAVCSMRSGSLALAFVRAGRGPSLYQTGCRPCKSWTLEIIIDFPFGFFPINNIISPDWMQTLQELDALVKKKVCPSSKLEVNFCETIYGHCDVEFQACLCTVWEKAWWGRGWWRNLKVLFWRTSVCPPPHHPYREPSCWLGIVWGGSGDSGERGRTAAGGGRGGRINGPGLPSVPVLRVRGETWIALNHESPNTPRWHCRNVARMRDLIQTLLFQTVVGAPDIFGTPSYISG